jgi:hypothetical protein
MFSLSHQQAREALTTVSLAWLPDLVNKVGEITAYRAAAATIRQAGTHRRLIAKTLRRAFTKFHRFKELSPRWKTTQLKSS